MDEQFLIRLYFLKKRHNAQKKNNVFYGSKSAKDI